MGKTRDDCKRRSSSTSSPRDETRSKRHRSKDDDNDSHSWKKHKSHKSSKRHSDKDKKSGEKRKGKGHKHDNSSVKFKIQELSNDDYFSKNNEFSLWLKKEREIFFSDLSSESARNLFSEFMDEWNNKELELEYYEGVAAGPRTSHKWNIKQ